MRLIHNFSCICIIKPWTPSHNVSFVLNRSNLVKNVYQFFRLTVLDIIELKQMEMMSQLCAKMKTA